MTENSREIKMSKLARKTSIFKAQPKKSEKTYFIVSFLFNVPKLAKNIVMNNELIRFEDTAQKDYSVIVSIFVG